MAGQVHTRSDVPPLIVTRPKSHKEEQVAQDKEQPETISQERYDAVMRERDASKTQVEEARNALDDYQKRDAARTALKGKVADPDAVADMITPHLADVKTEDVGDHIASDEFKPRLATFQPLSTQTTSTGGDGETIEEGGTTTPAVEEPGSFGGPSPGGTTGTQSLETTTKIKSDSPEYQEAVRTDNVEQIKKWIKDGQLETPARPWT